jgi:hypothetical protein
MLPILCKANLANANDLESQNFHENKIVFFEKDEKKIAIIKKSNTSEKQAFDLESEEGFTIIDLTKPRSWGKFWNQVYNHKSFRLHSTAKTITSFYVLKNLFTLTLIAYQIQPGRINKYIQYIFDNHRTLTHLMLIREISSNISSIKEIHNELTDPQEIAYLEAKDAIKKHFSKVVFIANGGHFTVLSKILNEK